MTVDVVTRELEHLLRVGELEAVAPVVATLAPRQVVEVLERLGPRRRSRVFQMLPSEQASAVFARLDPALQREALATLDDAHAIELFAGLDPDDRVRLLQGMPTSTATQLLAGLTPEDREETAAQLDYPRGSVGQWMNRRYLSAGSEATVEQALELVRQTGHEDVAGYALVVTDPRGAPVGLVGLRELIVADPITKLGTLASPTQTVLVSTDAELAARQCTTVDLLTLPVIDADLQVVGVFTGDDALRVLEEVETEDRAREGGSEPLRRPYLSTPVTRLVRSRVVWLLVLAVSAVLTVRVLETFESTLDQMVVLALFIPLLTGTGGNTGNQAATTVTRALALGDVEVRDMGRVLLREVRVGAVLGAMLGALGFLFATVVYGMPIGAVIGLTLFLVCTMAATVGGAMPLIGKSIRVDPAVFSNPFISTFCDATGLIMYFLIAGFVLHL